jgi:hypothetical protein
MRRGKWEHPIGLPEARTFPKAITVDIENG